MIEEWKIYSGNPNYMVSNQGRVARIMDMSYGGQNRYPKVSLDSGVTKKGNVAYVHRLVAETFLPVPNEQQKVIRHLDGNPLNNHTENLAWGTYAENQQDRKKHGTWGHKLTEDQVASIKRLLQNGNHTYQCLADAYGVSKPLIGRIARGQSWQHVEPRQ